MTSKSRPWHLKFILVIIAALAVGGYLTWEAQKDHLRLPYRMVAGTTAALTNPGDILFIGDANVEAWAQVAPILQDKVSAQLKHPLTLSFKALPAGGIQRVTAYLAELLAPPAMPSNTSPAPAYAKPQMVVYVMGRQELQECKMRPTMLAAITHQFALENNPRWSTLMMILPFLRPWLIDPGEPLVLAQPAPWPKMDEPTELKYRELATQLYAKELALLANFLKQQQITLAVLTAPLNLTTISEAWPSSNSLTLQKLLAEVSELLRAGKVRPAAQMLEPLKQFPGNAHTWFFAGKIASLQGDFATSMQNFKKAKSFSAERDEALPIYNILARQAASTLNFAVYDLAAAAEKYLWAQGPVDSAGYPAENFYQEQAPELGSFLAKLLY